MIAYFDLLYGFRTTYRFYFGVQYYILFFLSRHHGGSLAEMQALAGPLTLLPLES